MLNDSPYFSIVIPSYNSSRTIKRTLDSLVGQSYKNFEVVIVDDFSDDFDELQAVVNHYKNDLKIILERHGVNKNGSAARNTGVRCANAPYIAFLDSDDSWRADKLHIVNALLCHEVLTDRTIIYSKVNLYHGSKFLRIEPSRGIKLNESVGDYFFCSGQLMQTSSFVCSKSLALEVGFDERFTRHQDISFAMDAQKNGCAFIYIEEPLVNYMFPESGLKKRIKQNRINKEYCDYWLDTMSGHLSASAMQGYKFYVKSRVMMDDGQTFSAIFVRLVSFVSFSPSMHLSLMKKIWKRCFG